MKWISVDSTLESQRGIPVWSRNPTLHKPISMYFSKHMSRSVVDLLFLSAARARGDRVVQAGGPHVHAEGVAAGGSMPDILPHLSQVPSPNIRSIKNAMFRVRA